MIRYKSIAKGAASYVFSALRRGGTGAGGAFSAEGSYALFMRYLLAIKAVGESFEGKVVLELGPGSSFGIGFGALLTGATNYYAVDIIDHTVESKNIEIFDQMVAMISARANVRNDGLTGKIFPFIEDESLHRGIITDCILSLNLNSPRLQDIRGDLISKKRMYFHTYSSTRVADVVPDRPVDVILSESVLEHVDYLEATYAAFARWIAPNGVMAHLIDFGSHNLSREWNGHWRCSPSLWKVVRGKRHFLINRAPLQTHLDLLKANGFEVLALQLLRRVDGASLEDFDPQFRSMSFRDSTTFLAQVVSRRKG